MHGEIEYFTATGMYAASQAGIEATAPYVEAEIAPIKYRSDKSVRPTRAEKWVRVTDDMGFPAGLPRTITADLSGKLPQGTHAHPHHDQPANLLGQHSHRPQPAERRTSS